MRESLLGPSCLQPHAEHGFRASISSFGGMIEQVILLSLSTPLIASSCMSRKYSLTTGELLCARLKTLVNHWRGEQHLICIAFCRHKKKNTYIILLTCHMKYPHTRLCPFSVAILVQTSNDVAPTDWRRDGVKV